MSLTGLAARTVERTPIHLHHSRCPSLRRGRGLSLDDLGNSMRGFERRNNSFGSSQQHGRLQRFGVTGGDVFGSAGVVEFGVLGAD